MKAFHIKGTLEAGCDEAGRGCLAGPVCAAAVILPQDFYHPELTDSKKLTSQMRDKLRVLIEKESIAYAVAFSDHQEIDQHNILKASILTMHKALDLLNIKPEWILVDGNKFLPYQKIPHSCIIRGDGLYFSIAAASVLAKTYRDEYMLKLHEDFPQYQWNKNKGYPTESHRMALTEIGLSPFHRKSFRLLPEVHQPTLF